MGSALNAGSGDAGAVEPDSEPRRAAVGGWLGEVTERLETARDELSQCFAASEIAEGMGIELRLEFDARGRVSSPVVAGDNDTCRAKDCIQAQIHAALSAPPLAAPSTPQAVRVVLRYHPSVTPAVELRTDGTTLNLRAIDCERWAALSAQRRERQEQLRRELAKPLGDLERYRSGLENYVSVEPSKQGSLGSARVPFASYLNLVHNAVHPEFSDRYLASLGQLPRTHPLADPDLAVSIEIVIDREGNIERMGVIASSGSVHFDANALHAFAMAAPFPPPPPEVLSADGRAYIHWELHRDPRYACSTYFARPFLLKP